MDEYGYGAAMRSGLEIFEMASRQSGRTMRLIERVNDGDRIICSTQKEADRLRRLLREVGKEKVSVSAIDPRTDPRERDARPPIGRTFFEHTWVFQHFVETIRREIEHIEHVQRQMSVHPGAKIIQHEDGRPTDRMLAAMRERGWV
jgi:hypothetical protein